jgi:1D-myo-inositol 3-kinase
VSVYKSAVLRLIIFLPRIIPQEFRSVDILHIAPVIGETDMQEWTSVIKAEYIAAGLQGFLRCISDKKEVKPNNWHPDFTSSVQIDYAFLSEEDLIGHDSLLSELMNKINIVVLTAGKNGSEVYNKKEIVKTGIYNTAEIDPTGAGDIYSAAFIYARAMGYPTTAAAKIGSAFASVIIEGRGGTVMNRLKEGWERWENITGSVLPLSI